MMSWRKALLIDGQLRPIWRFFLAAAMIVTAYVGVAIILGAIFGLFGWEPQVFVSLLWVNLLILPALLGISKILTGVFERKPLGSLGLCFCGRWKTEVGIGLGLGASMIFLVAILEHLLGLVRFAWSSSTPAGVLVAGCFSGVFLAIAAVNEEMVFRGYPFQRLVDSLGPAGAVLVSSALFGLAHLRNPFHTRVSALNTMLIGVPLAVAYLRTRGLWIPIGIHFAWNFIQGYGFGLPVSGLVLPQTLFKPWVHAVAWLTGGNYGPEGGVLASVAIVAATLYLMFSKSIYTSEEMKELLSGATPTGRGASDFAVLRLTSTESASRGQQDLKQ